MAKNSKSTIKGPEKRCLMCERKLSLALRLLRRRYCSTECAAEYKNLMTNLALARLNAAVGDQNPEMSALVRMMQIETEA